LRAIFHHRGTENSEVHREKLVKDTASCLTQLTGEARGRQGANVNIALVGEKYKNPQKFTEFSIDTKNGWA